jgi:hypothetical protein
MARPIKNYCDYFPHDRDMRNHRKIKAVRTKFGIEGYAIWSMLLEYLTGIDGNVFEYSEPEFELIGGDFGVSVETIRLVVDYCLKLELLFLKDGFVNSESLDERLKPVYIKRGVSKSNSQKQQRKDGKFVNNNTVNNGVSVTEKPQSKVNESKKDKKEDIIVDVPPTTPTKEHKKLLGIEDRAIQFKKEFNAFKNDYSIETLKEFYEYWIEPNKSKTKMRFEMEKTWDLNLRLKKWARNSFNNKKEVVKPKREPIKVDNREYWEIHHGHLGKTKEEIMEMVANGELE